MTAAEARLIILAATIGQRSARDDAGWVRTALDDAIGYLRDDMLLPWHDRHLPPAQRARMREEALVAHYAEQGLTRSAFTQRAINQHLEILWVPRPADVSGIALPADEALPWVAWWQQALERAQRMLTL